MSRVLIVKGTVDHDVYDLGLWLEQQGIECSYCHWYELNSQVGDYDLAVLFGLNDRDKNKADLYAGAVRAAVGPKTKFLIVSKWGRELMSAEQMREKYNAEYFVRHNPMRHLTELVLRLLQESSCKA